MRTHMGNTQSLKLQNDIVAHQQFLNHQRALHSNVKPVVSVKRKEQIKISRNNKVELNNDSKQHVNHLYSNIFSKQYKSTIDNKMTEYDDRKKLLANKVKRNKYQLQVKMEHQKELQSMNNRVKNCKNLQQRKKDKTDPIVNPAYFIKKSDKEIMDVTIDGYCKKILGINRPQSGLVRHEAKIYIPNKVQQEIEEKKMEITKSFGCVPNFAKTRPKSANHGAKNQNKFANDDLPGCTFKQILNHIVNHKLYKDVEMKVLYVRLCHRYGEQNVDDIWESLMDDLQK